MRARWLALTLLSLGCAPPDPSRDDDAPDAAAERDVADDRSFVTEPSPDAAPDRTPADASDAVIDVSSPDVSSPDVSSPDVSSPDVTTPDVPPPPPPSGDVLYPSDRSLSPITGEVADVLMAIARRGPRMSDREFSKVGASNTVNTNFLGCFAGARVDLAGRTALQLTIDHFRAGMLGGTTPFDRVSLAATVGWSARSAIAGSPSPLTRELAAVTPRQATVMFGTNDIQSRDIQRYAADMWTLTESLVAAGVVPLLTSIPARADSADADAWVPRYNAVTRALAQSRRTPYVDAHRELATLPGRGVGSDGLHLNVYTQGGAARGCVFTAEGLRYGHNVRNLLTLQTLDRVLGVTSRGAAAPDRDAPRLMGGGTPAAPFVVASLPFVDGRDTRASSTRAIARYTGCASTADESGPEFWYRLDLARATRVRAEVFARGTTDVDLHLVDRSGTAAGCVRRHDTTFTADLAPGVWYFVVDSYVAAGAVRAGEYLLTILAE